jgi:DNA helicase HerA-like ATPase
MHNNQLPASPYDPSRYVGSVSFISPDLVKVNLPRASTPSGTQYAGYYIPGGQVGEFVFIETEDYAVLGRITEVGLPDSERLKAEPALGKPLEAHPIGIVQLLTSLDLGTARVVSGIPQHPRIGQRVFSAHPLLVKSVVEGNHAANSGVIELAALPQDSQTVISVSPAHLLGRHCAVLGATGGGKSWTVARIVQEISRIGGRVILVDPTGEFHTYTKQVEHIYLGGSKTSDADDRSFVAFPYWQLTESDLFAVFQPSPGAQAPKLREALTSLKLVHLLNKRDGTEHKTYSKANTERGTFYRLQMEHTATIDAPYAEYNIRNLPAQLVQECVFETGGTLSAPDHARWGRLDERVRGYCETLISKVYSVTRSKALACMFAPEALTPVTETIEAFLKSPNRVLRISMEDLPFEHNARELLANALGRHLLGIARSGTFLENPTVVILDEAHQFLGSEIGDQDYKIKLDAFGLIAKEGRKYGLTVLLATQRPRDIPEDVLSQMGMFIVHRLINEKDRLVVEKACGNLDRSAAAFLPTLGQGEAILVGVDFPMPTPVKVTKPAFPPNSRGPDYNRFWTI